AHRMRSSGAVHEAVTLRPSFRVGAVGKNGRAPAKLEPISPRELRAAVAGSLGGGLRWDRTGFTDSGTGRPRGFPIRRDLRPVGLALGPRPASPPTRESQVDLLEEAMPQSVRPRTPSP